MRPRKEPDAAAAPPRSGRGARAAKRGVGPGDARTFTLLYKLSSLANRIEEPRVALVAILDALIEAFQAGSGSIALVSPDTGRLEIEVHKGLPLEQGDDLALRPGQGITGWVAFYGRPLLVPDVSADPRYVRVRPQVCCEMAVPMIETTHVAEESNQVLGVINLDCDTVGGFGPADLELLERCSAEVTIVMQRLWRLQNLQGKAQQLEVLISTGQSLVAQLEEKELLQTLVGDARRMLRAAACGLYLAEGQGEAVRLAACDIPGGPAEEAPLAKEASSVDDCAVGVVFHTRKAVEFSNIRSAEFADMPDFPRDPRLGSVLLTPLVREREVIGALAVFTEHQHRFSNDEKRLCAALASLALVALQNARLYARVFQSEDSLRKNEQLTTLGLLAAEIAHEIRNPLTVIKLLFGYLGLDFPPEDQRRTDVRVIGEKLDQLEAIVSRVLNIAKAPSSLHSRWNVAEIVEDTLVLIRLKLAQGKIQLAFDIPSRPLWIDAHKGQIQQVLLNLLLNATQAMPKGGRVAIRIGELEREAAHWVSIEVADTGAGIPEAVRARLFDSFLSGRPDGTGLGLSIAKRILRGHNGDIELLDTGPAGTTFRLLLPAVR